MAPIFESRRGLHFVLDPTLYECLIKTIISQQLNLAFAATLIERLIKRQERKSLFEGMVARFPHPFPKWPAWNTRTCSDCSLIAGRRKSVDRHFEENCCWRAGFGRDENASGSACDRSTGLFAGVGRWTAECLLLFGMGRSDLLPAADIGLRNALKKAYGLDKQPTEADVRQWGENWTPWRSYATFYLWDYLSGS